MYIDMRTAMHVVFLRIAIPEKIHMVEKSQFVIVQCFVHSEQFNAPSIETLASSTKMFRTDSNIMKLVFDTLSSQGTGGCRD